MLNWYRRECSRARRQFRMNRSLAHPLVLVHALERGDGSNGSAAMQQRPVFESGRTIINSCVL